jgi:hypothetical protein
LQELHCFLVEKFLIEDYDSFALEPSFQQKILELLKASGCKVPACILVTSEMEAKLQKWYEENFPLTFADKPNNGPRRKRMAFPIYIYDPFALGGYRPLRAGDLLATLNFWHFPVSSQNPFLGPSNDPLHNYLCSSAAKLHWGFALHAPLTFLFTGFIDIFPYAGDGHAGCVDVRNSDMMKICNGWQDLFRLLHPTELAEEKDTEQKATPRLKLIVHSKRVQQVMRALKWNPEETYQTVVYGPHPSSTFSVLAAANYTDSLCEIELNNFNLRWPENSLMEPLHSASLAVRRVDWIRGAEASLVASGYLEWVLHFRLGETLDADDMLSAELYERNHNKV